MELEERVLRNHNADMDELRYQALVSAPGIDLGRIDASGPTEHCALQHARHRFWRCYLGVDWPGMATPLEALDPRSGQVAINGHRFALWRQLAPDNHRIIHWIMLNPSTAGARHDDPTMQRVCDFSRRWGYGWVTVGNLWSYRAADPNKLYQWIKLGGEWVTRMNADCMMWVERMARRADLVVVACGRRGVVDNRCLAMLRLLDELGIEPHALAVTRTGQPMHPLYQPAELHPRPLAQLRQEAAQEAEQAATAARRARHDV